MNWHQLTSQETLSKLNAKPTGLTDAEVAEKRKTFGWNEIPEAGQRHWLSIFVKQFKSLLVFILLAAAFISGLTGHVVDVYVILAVILLNTLIGFFQELRAERAVASLKTMLVPMAKAIRNGEKTSVNAQELVPGDIVILEEGDSIPADARLIEAKNLRAIEAPLTGESVPVNKTSKPLAANTVLADQSNMVRKSTFISGGYGVAVVTGTGLNTAIGDIAKTLGNIKTEKTSFQKKTDTLARQMAIIAITSATLLFSVAYFIQESSLDEIFMIAIAALVSSIPEGLPAVLSIVLAVGANRMAARKAIIREFTATETLGAVTTIITDKTGTLTQNTLTVRRVGVGLHDEFQVTGEGWTPIGNFMKDTAVFDAKCSNNLQQVLNICGFSNNSDIQHNKENDTYQLIGDPTEGALLVLARKGGLFPKKATNTQKIDDLPFNSTIKMRATLIDNNNQRQLLVVGAPEQVLEKSVKIIAENGTEILTDDIKKQVRNKIEKWSGEAMRVIALAYRPEDSDANSINENLVDNLVFAGIVGMIDPPRPDVKQAVASCKLAGIRVVMATGDHINTAIAIAKATGIIDNDDNENIALTEKQLLNLDEIEFEKTVATINVFARLTPNMKLRIAEVLQRKGELIAMTGDGVNDAPALKKADVGIAMGIMGTDVARDSAKVVLSDDNFSTIVNAVEEGRIVFNNTRNTSFFLITTNFAEITTLISAIALGLPVPLTATQILWLNLVTDGACTTAMATESGHGNELQQKPINPNEKILNASILPFIIINSVLMATLAIISFKWFLSEGLEKARSAAFIIMAFSQLYNVFNMRDTKTSIFKLGMFTNKYINIGIVVSIIVQVMIIEVPFFERLFHFDPVSATEFIALGIAASLVLWVGELYKFLRNKI